MRADICSFEAGEMDPDSLINDILRQFYRDYVEAQSKLVLAQPLGERVRARSVYDLRLLTSKEQYFTLTTSFETLVSTATPLTRR
jgi:hypothetical protein